MRILLQPKKELDDTLEDVVFLHRAMPGACTDSFGWHCAANAGLPDDVIARAREVSSARAEGEPIHKVTADSELFRQRNALIVAVVDGMRS